MWCQATGPDPPGSSGTSSTSLRSIPPVDWEDTGCVTAGLCTTSSSPFSTGCVPFCESVSRCRPRRGGQMACSAWSLSLVARGHLCNGTKRGMHTAQRCRQSSLQQQDEALSLFPMLQVRNCQMRLRPSCRAALEFVVPQRKPFGAQLAASWRGSTGSCRLMARFSSPHHHDSAAVCSQQ